MPVHRPLTVEKTHIDSIIDADSSLTRLVYTYIASAACWLVLGGLVGEYAGVRLAFPDLSVHPLLSFGRLRPVHTNVVLWGWSSLGMIGLALVQRRWFRTQIRAFIIDTSPAILLNQSPPTRQFNRKKGTDLFFWGS